MRLYNNLWDRMCTRYGCLPLVCILLIIGSALLIGVEDEHLIGEEAVARVEDRGIWILRYWINTETGSLIHDDRGSIVIISERSFIVDGGESVSIQVASRRGVLTLYTPYKESGYGFISVDRNKAWYNDPKIQRGMTIISVEHRTGVYVKWSPSALSRRM